MILLHLFLNIIGTFSKHPTHSFWLRFSDYQTVASGEGNSAVCSMTRLLSEQYENDPVLSQHEVMRVRRTKELSIKYSNAAFAPIS